MIPAHVLHGAAATSSSGLAGRWAANAALVAVPLAAGGLALALGPRRPKWAALAGGAGVVALIASGRSEPLVEAVHVAGAAVWIGAMVAMVVTRRRLHRVAVGGAAVTVVTGVVSAVAHFRDTADVKATSFGHVFAGKALLALVVLTIGTLAWRYGSNARWWRAELAGGAAVAILGSLLVSLPAPAAAAPGDGPVIEELLAGKVQVALLVTPNRAGLNLIHVSASTGDQSDNLVRLSPGIHRVAVAAGPVRTHAVIRVGLAPPEPVVVRADPECAAAVIGRLLVRRTEGGCPAADDDSLATAAGRAYGKLLAPGRPRTVAVVGASSPRTTALLAALRAALPATAVTPSDAGHAATADAAILASATTDGPAAVAAIRDAGSPARGLFLAPWLLDGAALDAMTAARAQDQLTVASPIDLQGRAATAYLTALGRRLPAQRPSLAGLASFIATATGRALPINGITLYSPAQVSFLPPSLDAGHDAHGAGPSWLTAGDLLVTSTAALG